MQTCNDKARTVERRGNACHHGFVRVLMTGMLTAQPDRHVWPDTSMTRTPCRCLLVCVCCEQRDSWDLLLLNLHGAQPALAGQLRLGRSSHQGHQAPLRALLAPLTPGCDCSHTPAAACLLVLQHAHGHTPELDPQPPAASPSPLVTPRKALTFRTATQPTKRAWNIL